MYLTLLISLLQGCVNVPIQVLVARTKSNSENYFSPFGPLMAQNDALGPVVPGVTVLSLHAQLRTFSAPFRSRWPVDTVAGRALPVASGLLDLLSPA